MCGVSEGFTNPDEVQVAFLETCIKRLSDYDPTEFSVEDIVASAAFDFFGFGSEVTPITVHDEGNVISVM